MAAFEYLIILGLLTGAVILAVVLAGESMRDTWMSWAQWLSEDDNVLTPPST